MNLRLAMVTAMTDARLDDGGNGRDCAMRSVISTLADDVGELRARANINDRNITQAILSLQSMTIEFRVAVAKQGEQFRELASSLRKLRDDLGCQIEVLGQYVLELKHGTESAKE